MELVRFVPSFLRQILFSRQGALLLALLLAGGCRSDRRAAIAELDQRGVEANGRAVLEAVAKEHRDELDLLLRAGAYTGQRDPLGRTPLHLAIDARRTGMAEQLVLAGADVTATDRRGISPLGIALFQGETALVDLLLDRGATADCAMPDGDRSLPWAIRNGRLSFVRRLMEKGADPHQKDGRGSPLLHVAMECGRADLAAELVHLGADCGATNADGESTLVVALRRGWTDQMPALVHAGADPNRPDRDGLTPFARALRDGDFGLAGRLRGLGARPDAARLHDQLAKAYRVRDHGMAARLLGLGADPTLGGDLVRQAAADGSHGFLHLFLGYRRPPEDLLIHACRQADENLTSLLLAHGASPNPTNAPFLDNAFATMLRHGGDRRAHRLLRHGAAPGLRQAHGQSALVQAVIENQPTTVRWLLENGADPNQELNHPVQASFLEQFDSGSMRWVLRNNRRITPLMIAAHCGSLESAEALIDHGARTNVWTRGTSMWPINFASQRGDVPMMRLLLGKDPHVEERLLILDLGEQRLRVFDRSGVEIFETRVSSGRPGYRTRTGEFAITNKYRSWTSTIYHASMPYFQRLSCSDFGFHQGYVPNHPASHGCIRVPAGNASKLFAITELGDRVRIVK